MSIRKSILMIATAAILVVSLAGCSAALVGAAVSPKIAAQAQQTSAPTGSGITVVGMGQVSASPDIARVVIGVDTQGNDIKKAISDNNTKMNALLASIKTAGIAAKDIQTMNYSVSVETPQPQNVTGSAQSTKTDVIYHVSNQVQVTIRDLSKLSDLLDQAVSSGANTIYGVSFDVSDPSKLEDQARTIAVADAKSRADKLAQLEGLTLGSVVTVSEVTANPGPVYAASYALGKGGGGAPIEGGNIQVSVNLQVTYAIK